MDIARIREIRHLTSPEDPATTVLVPVGDLRELLDAAELLERAREILSEREWNYSRTNRRVREALGVPDPVTFRASAAS